MKRIQGTSGNATLAFYFVFILFFFIFAATFEGFLMKLFWSSFKRHFLPLLFTREVQDELSFK